MINFGAGDKTGTESPGARLEKGLAGGKRIGGKGVTLAHYCQALKQACLFRRSSFSQSLGSIVDRLTCS